MSASDERGKETATDAHCGDVTFCVVGMTDDLRRRGLSQEDIQEVLAEIDRRRRLYRENADAIPAYGDGVDRGP